MPPAVCALWLVAAVVGVAFLIFAYAFWGGAVFVWIVAIVFFLWVLTL